jgi:hypothetical protein
VEKQIFVNTRSPSVIFLTCLSLGLQAVEDEARLTSQAGLKMALLA